jgi:hypothetical protein
MGWVVLCEFRWNVNKNKYLLRDETLCPGNTNTNSKMVKGCMPYLYGKCTGKFPTKELQKERVRGYLNWNGVI